MRILKHSDFPFITKTFLPCDPVSSRVVATTTSRISKFRLPFRPPPPTVTDDEDSDYTYFTNQHNSTRHFSRPESSHKGKNITYGQI